MPKIKSDNRQTKGLLNLPVRWLLLMGFVLVAVFPVSLMGYKLYHVAWQEAWREITEKHQLLAQNLAAPISVYIRDQRISLEQLGDVINFLKRAKGEGLKLDARQRDFVLNAMRKSEGFLSVSLVSLDGHVQISTRDLMSHEKQGMFKQVDVFTYVRTRDRWFLSGIAKSPFDQRPGIIMSTPVRDGHGKQIAVLLAELRIDYIERLRKGIKFGKKGHSAIVDNYGHAIAHPNPGWMKSMHDMSPLLIVQKMMDGQTGVTEFYSPFIQENMVAGYTSVPGINWGIMVPQPKSEVEAHVRKILNEQLIWGLVGLSMALLLAWLLTRWLTRPMRRLCASATMIAENDFKGDLPELTGAAPREIRQMRERFVSLVNGMQEARNELDDFNRSLQQRVSDATKELRGANRQLQVFASQDYLTKLFNRRYFESTILQRISAEHAPGERFCLMMIDIDNFKPINDRYGNAAGDYILISLATLFKEQIGEGHLIARYSGDQFIVLINEDLANPEQLAKQVMDAVRSSVFEWHGDRIRITLSVGLVYQLCNELCTLDTLIHGADRALLMAKDGNEKLQVVGL